MLWIFFPYYLFAGGEIFNLFHFINSIFEIKIFILHIQNFFFIINGWFFLCLMEGSVHTFKIIELFLKKFWKLWRPFNIHGSVIRMDHWAIFMTFEMNSRCICRVQWMNFISSGHKNRHLPSHTFVILVLLLLLFMLLHLYLYHLT